MNHKWPKRVTGLRKAKSKTVSSCEKDVRSTAKKNFSHFNQHVSMFRTSVQDCPKSEIHTEVSSIGLILCTKLPVCLSPGFLCCVFSVWYLIYFYKCFLTLFIPICDVSSC